MDEFAIFQNGVPEPCPDQFNLAAYVLEAAKITPEKTALEVLGAPGVVQESWTYGDLTSAIQGTAAGLSDLGLGRGDKLVLRLGHRSDFPIIFLAAISLGAIPVPTSAQLTVAEFDWILADLGEVFGVVLDEALDAPAHPVTILERAEVAGFRDLPPCPFASTAKDDPAYVVYTSGSSGQPKGVVHAHRAVWARRMMWRGWYGLQKTDRMLHAGAFNWTFTLGTGLLDPWAAGATAVVYAGLPHRHIWSELAHTHMATLFAGAPGVFRQLLTSERNLSADFSTLRHALSAGEALPETVRETWEHRTGCDIHEALGMSEISTFISGAPGDYRDIGTIGLPQPGRHVAVIGDDGPVGWGEVGTLAVHKSDPGLMLGYYRKDGPPELPLTGDWFLTGDRVSMARGGAVSYHGRADTLITAGGYRISPEEVEAVLIRFPEIDDVAVAVVDVKAGATVLAAFYVANEKIAEDALSAYMNAHVAKYKQPRIFQRVQQLPRGANGKLKRDALGELWNIL